MLQLFLNSSCKKKIAEQSEISNIGNNSNFMKNSFETDSSFFKNFKVYAKSENRPVEELCIIKSVLFNNDKILCESTDSTNGYFTGIELTDITKNEIPEMILHSVCRGSSGYDYSNIYIFINNKWKKLEIFDGDGKFDSGFVSHNEYYVKDRKLYNEFQMFNINDKNCCPTTGKIKTIKYVLKNDTFFPISVKEIPDPDWEEMKKNYSNGFEENADSLKEF